MNTKNISRYLFILLVFFLAITLFTLFGKKGLISIYHLNQEYKQIVKLNDKLNEERRKLEREIRLLRNDHSYIEKIAREESGLVKKGEVVYLFR